MHVSVYSGTFGWERKLHLHPAIAENNDNEIFKNSVL